MLRKRKRVRVGDWPRLTRFYGITPRELAAIPHWLTELYAEQLPELEAHEQLLVLQAADYPNLDMPVRRRIHRSFLREFPAAPAPKIDLTTESGKALARSLGIGVRVGK